MLEMINTSSNPYLEVLSLSDNNITDIDLRKNVRLSKLLLNKELINVQLTISRKVDTQSYINNFSFLSE